MLHVVYLHGFASSARSSKAMFLAGKLAEKGIPLQTPDLNEPDFGSLTITRMLDQVAALVAGLPPGPVALVGSSLGAFVSILAAERDPERIAKLVLLAPAVDFSGNRLRDLGDRGIEQWRTTNQLNVFHYGYGRMVPVRFDLYTDAARYDAFNARVDVPVLIFQGTRDEAVNPGSVRRWAAARPNATLHLLDDDHQLLSSLDVIWTESAAFLSL